MKKILLFLILINSNIISMQKDLPQDKYNVADCFYIHFSDIHPGQIRISNSNIETKIKQAFTKNALVIDQGSKTGYKYFYNNGTSVIDLESPLPVILGPYPYNIVLVDGHHELMASLKLGAEYIGVKIVEDLRNLSKNEFWLKAFEKGYVYPFTITGKFQIPSTSFHDLQDDPNRYFAAILARKIDKNKVSSDAKKDSYAANFPIWLKIGKPAFVEFILADLFRKNNLIYDDKKYANNPPEEFVEFARSILIKEDVINKINISGFNFINNKEDCKNLNPFN